MRNRCEVTLEPKPDIDPDKVDAALVIAAIAYAQCRTDEVLSLDIVMTRYSRYQETIEALRELTVEQEWVRLDNAAGMRSDRMETYHVVSS